MRLKNMNKSLIGIFVAVAAVSCSDELVNNDELRPAGGEYSDDISFVVYDNNSTTRGGSTESRRCGGAYLLNSSGTDSLYMQMEVSDIPSPLPTRGSDLTEGSAEMNNLIMTCRLNTTNGYSYYFHHLPFTNNGTVWASNPPYYWLPQDTHYNFYGFAPATNEGLVYDKDSNDTDCIPTLEYTVPSDAKKQCDLVYNINTQEYIATTTQAYPLKMNHALAKVAFKTGSGMAAGTIKSVTITNVKDKGTLNLETGDWTFDTSSTKDFSIAKDISGDNQAINDNADRTYFFLLPESTTAETEVFIEFLPEGASQNDTKTYTASLKNTVWEAGKQYLYTITITPEYELEFTSNPVPQDAHYIIYPITIKADDKLPKGGWTLTSNDTENVTFVESGKFESEDLEGLITDGYWLEDYIGSKSITSTSTGDVKVYVFIRENATESDREITLSLKPTATGNYEEKSFTFTQYCPAWNGDLGVERIQDKDYPWGFNWDSSMKITYDMGTGFGVAILNLYLKWLSGIKYISSEGYGIFNSVKITIDFSKVGTLETATSETDGNTNTWELYNFNGVNEASALITQLEGWGGTPNKDLPSNPSEFAARACAMKNKYKTEKQTQNGKTVYNPKLQEADMVWYLPARDEASSMKDNLNGDYWTSTSITDPGTTAYKYTAGGSVSSEDRNTLLHVRAVRKKTTAN